MFKVTGVSTFKGEVKVRFANDLTRVKLLQKAGNTDIELIELDEPKSKLDCALALKASELYTKAEYAAAIDAAVEKYSPQDVQPKKTRVKKDSPSLEAIRSRAKSKNQEQPAAQENQSESEPALM